VFPDRAAYKVLVRGDSATSTVSVTVRWTHGGVPEDPQVVECRTKDVRERELEAAIKLGAETVVARDATPVNASVGRAWDAVLDLFAARQIAISTWERASGFIGTDQWDVPGSEARRPSCATSGHRYEIGPRYRRTRYLQSLRQYRPPDRR